MNGYQEFKLETWLESWPQTLARVQASNCSNPDLAFWPGYPLPFGTSVILYQGDTGKARQKLRKNLLPTLTPFLITRETHMIQT